MTRFLQAKQSSMLKRLIRKYRWLIGAFAVPVILLLAGTALIVVDDLGTADVAVVLGSKVELDGKPSARLRARLDRTLEIYRQNLCPWIITSGGVGKEGFDEAAVMRDYLAANGVPRDRILVDSLGINTARLAREHGFRAVIVVSQYFHLPRSELALRRNGFSTVHTAHARWFEWRDVYSSVREAVGYVVYWYRG
jgi:vancomycin permeability regulator SanA